MAMAATTMTRYCLNTYDHDHDMSLECSPHCGGVKYSVACVHQYSDDDQPHQPLDDRAGQRQLLEAVAAVQVK
jgi:hypothetical protein